MSNLDAFLNYIRPSKHGNYASDKDDEIVQTYDSKLKSFGKADTTLDQSVYSGIVLRVETISSDGDELLNFEPGSLPMKRYYGKTASHPELVTLKIRIPCLHYMLPNPHWPGDTSANCVGKDSDPQYVKKCHHGIIDMYPTFYGEKPGLPVPEVGTIVKVKFGDIDNLKDPVYLGPEVGDVYLSAGGLEAYGSGGYSSFKAGAVVPPLKTSNAPDDETNKVPFQRCHDYEGNPPRESRTQFKGDYYKMRTPHTQIYGALDTQQYGTCEKLRIPSRTPQEFMKRYRRGNGNPYAAVRRGKKNGGGYHGYHNGEDVYVPAGSIVYAPFEGQVTKGPFKIAESAGGGMGIVFKSASHPLQIRLIHLNQDTRLGSRGQNYREGEVIGTSYTSSRPNNKMPGNSPSHIHLEAQNVTDGQFTGDVNPYSAFDASRLVLKKR
ncbi:peptidoglycan DD-metalloendopeptidase family protein [Luminiphilus sp.]|nr:peptidoglycan DD-metalloendopeptidase family protein [Luminiphilus sp.]